MSSEQRIHVRDSNQRIVSTGTMPKFDVQSVEGLSVVLKDQTGRALTDPVVVGASGAFTVTSNYMFAEGTYNIRAHATIHGLESVSDVTQLIVQRDDGDAQYILSGNPIVGQEMSVALFESDPDGNGDTASFKYQWQRSSGDDYVNIDGAEASSYTVSSEDVGETLRCIVEYRDGHGFEEIVNSTPSNTVWWTSVENVIEIEIVDNVYTMVPLNGEYEDKGAIAKHFSYGPIDVTAELPNAVIDDDGVSKVWTDVAGFYSVTYTASHGGLSASAVRSNNIRVVDFNPRVTLKGNADDGKFHMPHDGTYVEPGFDVLSRHDKDLSEYTGGHAGGPVGEHGESVAFNVYYTLTVTNNVNANTVGEYTINYELVHWTGTTNFTRTVVVEPVVELRHELSGNLAGTIVYYVGDTFEIKTRSNEESGATEYFIQDNANAVYTFVISPSDATLSELPDNKFKDGDTLENSEPFGPFGMNFRASKNGVDGTPLTVNFVVNEYIQGILIGGGHVRSNYVINEFPVSVLEGNMAFGYDASDLEFDPPAADSGLSVASNAQGVQNKILRGPSIQTDADGNPVIIDYFEIAAGFVQGEGEEFEGETGSSDTFQVKFKFDGGDPFTLSERFPIDQLIPFTLRLPQNEHTGLGPFTRDIELTIIHVNDGMAAFQLNGEGVVGTSLELVLANDDPDAGVAFLRKVVWQTRTITPSVNVVGEDILDRGLWTTVRTDVYGDADDVMTGYDFKNSPSLSFDVLPEHLGLEIGAVVEEYTDSEGHTNQDLSHTFLKARRPSYDATVSADNKYIIDGVETPTLELDAGHTYIFGYPDEDNRIEFVSADGVDLGIKFDTNKTAFTPSGDDATVNYRCKNSAVTGGTINVTINKNLERSRIVRLPVISLE